jgi:flagellar protein FlbT
MPLRIKLRPDERVIVNGALISARQATALVIHNRVSLLRERQILPPALATTPARRIYYALQCAYVADPEERGGFHEMALGYARDFREATLSEKMRGIVDQILELAAAEEYYKAMRAAQDVMEYEDFVLQQKPWEQMADEQQRTGG